MRSSYSKVQQSKVTSPWALIQILIHFTPMMRVKAKAGTARGFQFILSSTHIYSVIVDDLCNLGGFPSFGPGVLKAREFNYSLLVFEENRLCKAVVTTHASPALASSSREILQIRKQSFIWEAPSLWQELRPGHFWLSQMRYKFIELSYISLC